MGNLTSSKEHYIKTVYELSTYNTGVRISDIAAKMGVTKTSACLAIQALEKKQLIRRDEQRLVFLTDEGERQAILTKDKYTIIKQFLLNVLELDEATADQDACAMEHVISEETLCAFCKKVNNLMNQKPCQNPSHSQEDCLHKKEVLQS